MKSIKGLIYAVVSSSTFGLVPLFAIPALKAGVSVNSVVFYRFAISALLVGLVLLAQRESFRIAKRQLPVIAGFALLYAAAFAIMLRYAMAPYLLADAPDDGAAAAVWRSVEMMRGRKWELFKLQFSFMGWYILQILLSGIVLAVLLIRSGVLNTPLTPDSLLTYQAVINGLSAFFLTNLISLPLAVWIIPYTSVAQAGFYDTVRQQEPVYDHEEMPPL